MLRSPTCACLPVLFACIGIATAHRPIFSDQPGTNPQTAVTISQPHISQVIYRELTDERPELWLAVDMPASQPLFVQIGLPALKPLETYRPHVLVVGPGLPHIDAPVNLPADAGAIAFSTTDVTEPRFFHEHFTRTDSWILGGWTIHLPQAGRYYVVACDPSGHRGKLWLSVGRNEQFSAADWFKMDEWTRKIRAFHEADKTTPSMNERDRQEAREPDSEKKTPPKPDHHPREGTEWCNIWIPRANTEALPRVLLVGDSITQQYYRHVATALEGKANCAYVTTSWSVCNPALRAQLEVICSQYDFAAIHFNNGLHGFGYTEPQYEKALRRTLTWLKAQCPAGRLIIANSTPIRPGTERASTNERIKARNAIVADLARTMDLPLNDLHTPMLSHGESYTDDYHFADTARQIQARQVTRHVNQALQQ